jgi:hypothetical protein
MQSGRHRRGTRRQRHRQRRPQRPCRPARPRHPRRSPAADPQRSSGRQRQRPCFLRPLPVPTGALPILLVFLLSKVGLVSTRLLRAINVLAVWGRRFAAYSFLAQGAARASALGLKCFAASFSEGNPLSGTTVVWKTAVWDKCFSQNVATFGGPGGRQESQGIIGNAGGNGVDKRSLFLASLPDT